MDPIDALAVLRLVPELFQITKALEAAAPGRHFTPDGHLVGSIGEAVAAARYGLELTTASTKGVDAHHKASGRSVEIRSRWRASGSHCVGWSQRPTICWCCGSIAMAAQAKSSTVRLHRCGLPQDGYRATASVL